VSDGKLCEVAYPEVTSVDIFSWDHDFATGLDDVDHQHHHLVTLINEFGTLVSHNNVQTNDLEKLYAELVSYTQYHFAEEKKLMTESSLDSRHVSHHENEHQNFLQEVTLMHQQMLSVSGETGQELFEFLMNWLVYHILGSDMSMARQHAAIRNGSPAQDAFLGEERAVDKATRLLLGSLNKLFHQVSRRNRQLNELNQSLETKVEQRTRELSEANRQLGVLALTDTLTGVSNRRYAMQMLDRLWEESAAKTQSLSCLMIDADGFKVINDTYGHDAGDLVLRELAKQLIHAVRTDDIVCRLGGDEFLVICLNTSLDGALYLARQTHARVADMTVPVAGGAWHGSISVGVAERTAAMQRPEDLLKAADLGVYAAKNAGRNCVKTGDDISVPADVV